MGKIVTIAIHKGGTGKTTVAAHLAFVGAERALAHFSSISTPRETRRTP